MNWLLASGAAHLAVHRSAGTMALAPSNLVPNLVPNPSQELGPDRDGIVTINVDGMLVPRGMYHGNRLVTSYDAIPAILDTAQARSDVSGVILDIDSAGGYASGCFSAARHIRECPLPVAAVANPLAYSAAYALASAASRIFAQEDSGLGSIGAISLHVDCSEAIKRAGLVATVFRAGERKAWPTSVEPLSDEDRAEVAAELQEINRQFIELVARNRGIGIDAVEGLQARCLFGAAAKAARMEEARTADARWRPGGDR